MNFLYPAWSWFYGNDLRDYLLGILSPLQTANTFWQHFAIAGLVGVIIPALFYVVFQRSSWAKRVIWLGIWGLSMLLSFVLTLMSLVGDKADGLMVRPNPENTNETLELTLNAANFMAFSLVNAIYAGVICLVASLIFARITSTYKNIPF